jgi:hypothetical protein
MTTTDRGLVTTVLAAQALRGWAMGWPRSNSARSCVARG